MMQTVYSHVRFEPDTTGWLAVAGVASRVAFFICRRNRDNARLGDVALGPCGPVTFIADDSTEFENECLDEIKQFIRQLESPQPNSVSLASRSKERDGDEV